MPITVACQCGAKFAAQDHLAGKRVRCPKCAQPLQIPAAEAPAARWTGNPASSRSPTPPPPPAPLPPIPEGPDLGGMFDDAGMGAISGVRCPQCGSDTPPNAVLCVKCGFNLKKMRQQKVEGDKAAARRREAILEKQRRESEKQAKQVANARQVSGGTAMDLGGVTEAATAVLRFPSESFERLSPLASLQEAYSFAVTAAVFIALFWATYYTAYFFLIPLVGLLQQPDVAKEIGKAFEFLLPRYGKAIAYLTGAYAVLIAVWLCIIIPAMAGIAHLLLKYVGESRLSYFATLRVFVYTTGAAWLLAGLPCVGVIAPVIWPLNTSIGLAVHHKVNPGIAMLAMLLSVVTAIVVSLVLSILFGAAVLAWLLANILPQLEARL